MHQNEYLWSKGINTKGTFRPIYHAFSTFNNTIEKKKPFQKQCGKWRKSWLSAFSISTSFQPFQEQILTTESNLFYHFFPSQLLFSNMTNGQYNAKWGDSGMIPVVMTTIIQWREISKAVHRTSDPCSEILHAIN